MSDLNEKWALSIVDTLIQLGADYFVCAPGSRSTPLLMAVASHLRARSIVHFDERGLGFHALGYAKASGKPAVVVVTSGTAVANLLPAVMEADLDKIPLILLTADRPPELQDCGANQTCDQVNLFKTQVRWQVNLPCPETNLEPNYLISTVAQAITMTTAGMPGPVQINCAFREPLLGNKICVPALTVPQFVEGELHLDEETLTSWSELLKEQTRGIILMGSDSECLGDSIFALAEKLKWPIIADILSPTRTYKEHPLLITHSELILKTQSLKLDALIQFGNRMVSKEVSEWIQKFPLKFYLQISKHTRRQDPCHRVTHRLQVSPRIFIQEILPLLTCQEAPLETQKWIHYNTLCKDLLTIFFKESEKLTEPGALWQLQTLLSKGWPLFLANSMPIRDANQFYPAGLGLGRFFGNRGVSGIDGNIATATGIVQGQQSCTVALLGDLSFLHDLNSLALLHKLNYPLILCVINNQGGGIFSFLPIAERKEHFETFVVASHAWTLSFAAKLFNIPYFHPTNPNAFEDVLNQLTKDPKSCLIEIQTQRQENVEVHQHILDRVKRCLNATPFEEETLLTLS